jgi:hypothetical protein
MFIRSAFKQDMDRSRRILVYAIEANVNLLGRLGLHGRLGLLDESGATKYEVVQQHVVCRAVQRSPRFNYYHDFPCAISKSAKA